MVFSDEGLFSAGDRTIRRMRRLTRRLGGKTRLVVYLRRQDDHLVSRYQQVVKMGEVTPLTTWAKQDWVGTYDYHLRLTSWQELEPDAFVVRRFERERMVNGSLVSDFLDAAGIGLDEATLTHTEPRNESLGAEAIELLRILNIYRVKHEGERPGLFGNHHHVVKLRELPPARCSPCRSPDLDRFMTPWEDSNRRVAREFLDDATQRAVRGRPQERARPRSSASTRHGSTTTSSCSRSREAQHAAIRRIAKKEAGRRRAVSARAARRHFARRLAER